MADLGQLLLQQEVGLLVLLDKVEQFQFLACPSRHFLIVFCQSRGQKAFVKHCLELWCNAKHSGVNKSLVEVGACRKRIAVGHTVAASGDHSAEPLVGIVVKEEQGCRLAQEREGQQMIDRGGIGDACVGVEAEGIQYIVTYIIQLAVVL